jgi:hypothetical protein
MREIVLLGRGNRMVSTPKSVLDKHLAQAPEHGKERLRFMTAGHHAVRYYVVQELARSGKPLRPETIGDNLGTPLDKVISILDDLEKHLVFLVRNEEGAVSWAFPVTVERTPHKVSFSSGEQLYAA